MRVIEFLLVYLRILYFQQPTYLPHVFTQLAIRRFQLLHFHILLPYRLFKLLTLI